MDIHGLGVDRETGLQRATGARLFAQRCSPRIAPIFLTKPLLCKPRAGTITRLFPAFFTFAHYKCQGYAKRILAHSPVFEGNFHLSKRVEGVPANLYRTAKLLRLLPSWYTLFVCLQAPDSQCSVQLFSPQPLHRSINTHSSRT